MNYTETLIGLLDRENPAIKAMGEITGEKLVEYYRERKNPVYLFSLEDAEKLKDDEIIADAERVMEHDIFGYKFNGPIDWMFNPTTETSRDNEWSWSLFRTIYWQPLARAYALTKDEKYTREFLSQMHSFRQAWPADDFIKDFTFVPKQPFPGTAWRTIETGIRVYTTWLPVFEIFRHSPVWTGEDLSSFILGIRDHALFLMGHYSNHDRSSNWLSMETSALLQIAIMFPELKEAKEWFNTAYGRVMHEVRFCFSDNGIHMEKTPIYHTVASIAFAQALVMCRLNGIYVPDYAWEVIRRSALYVASLVKPDFSTPMIGDADRDDLTTRRADTSVYEGMNLSFFPEDLNELRAYMKWMYSLFGDEEFLYFATLGKEGKAPEKTDFKYSEEGIYVMRSGWGKDADYLCTHSTQLELGERSTHSHNDCMHAEVTLKGEDVLVDCGRYIYRSSIWKDWRAYFCSALAHNTLYVDDHEMGEIKGVDRRRNVRALCHFFGEDKGLKIIDLSHNGYAYLTDPVFHRRKLIQLPSSSVVLVDYVEGPGKEDHDFRLMFNFNTTDVVLDGSHVDYKSRNGLEFDLDFASTVDFSSRLLCGSEDPKGGWISYGYPVREPIGQVTFAYGSKAPFAAVTVVKAKDEDTVAYFENATVVIESHGRKWIVGKEGVEEA
ncbi:MAG: alginate lyase family protein [Candidatus Ornithospirochaeta sp.]